jgi:general nucleoside transport system ATP-binding protein
MPLALEMKGITKRFPGVLANDHISFQLHQGEIHCLLGENGAGKTTLMNILYGLYRPDDGQILLNGKEIHIRSPHDAIAQGIGMVHQHFMLIPVMTVTENVVLGMEVVHNGVLDLKTAAQRIREFSHQYGLDVDPDAYVKDLPVGVQQRVEIIKTLYRDAEILILDEPTAVLTPQETDELFQIMRGLTDQGKSIIFISHKLKEVMAIADRIIVLRNGRVTGQRTPAETSEEDLAEMMVGREVALIVDKGSASPGEVVLEVTGLTAIDIRKQPVLRGIDLFVRAGEVLGVAGVQGNGQTELVEALTGLHTVTGGSVYIMGQEVTNASPRTITALGVAHIPEDRQSDGLVLSFPIFDNLILCTYYQPPFARGPALQFGEVYDYAERLAREFDVRTPSIALPVQNLSGGNQQKVIVAREFSRPIKLLIAAQPTRGLDVGSIEYIHRRLVQKRDEGVAVLLISVELDEIMALSDRIAVMYEGKIVGTVDADKVTREELGLLMAGTSLQEATRKGTKGEVAVG